MRFVVGETGGGACVFVTWCCKTEFFSWGHMGQKRG